MFSKHAQSHTGQNITALLKVAINKWELQPATIVTDNARNMDVAVSGLGHIRCLAHTLNLAAFFHRGSTATVTLASKQKLLGLPLHILMIDVSTWWFCGVANSGVL